MNKSFTLIFILVLFALQGFSQEQKDSVILEQKYKMHMEKGMEYSNTGEFQLAIAEFEKALLIKKSDVEAQHRIKENQIKYQEKIKFKKEQLEKLEQAADKKLEAGDYQSAKNYYERYNSLSGTNKMDEKIKICEEKLAEKK